MRLAATVVRSRVVAMEDVFEVSVVDEDGEQEEGEEEGGGEEEKGGGARRTLPFEKSSSSALMVSEKAAEETQGKMVIMCIPPLAAPGKGSNQSAGQSVVSPKRNDVMEEEEKQGDLQEVEGDESKAADAGAAVCRHCGCVQKSPSNNASKRAPSAAAADGVALRDDKEAVMNSEGGTARRKRPPPTSPPPDSPSPAKQPRVAAEAEAEQKRDKEEDLDTGDEDKLIINVVDDDEEEDEGSCRELVLVVSESRGNEAPSSAAQSSTSEIVSLAIASPSQDSAAKTAPAATSQSSPAPEFSPGNSRTERLLPQSSAVDDQEGPLGRLESSVNSIPDPPENAPKIPQSLMGGDSNKNVPKTNILPKWQIRTSEQQQQQQQEQQPASVFSTTNATLRATRASKGYDGTIDPGCTKNDRATILTSQGPVDVRILKNKAEKGPDGLYRCPVTGCEHPAGSRVYVAKHFTRDHPDYRSWREMFLNPDAPEIVVRNDENGDNSNSKNSNNEDNGSNKSREQATASPEESVECNVASKSVNEESRLASSNAANAAAAQEEENGTVDFALVKDMSEERVEAAKEDEEADPESEGPPRLSPQLPTQPLQEDEAVADSEAAAARTAAFTISSSTETSWAAANRAPLCSTTGFCINGAAQQLQQPLLGAAALASPHLAQSAFATVPQRPPVQPVALPAAVPPQFALDTSSHQAVMLQQSRPAQQQPVFFQQQQQQPVAAMSVFPAQQQHQMQQQQQQQLPSQPPHVSTAVPMALVPLSHLTGSLGATQQIHSGAASSSLLRNSASSPPSQPQQVQKYKIIQVMVPKRVAAQAQSLAAQAAAANMVPIPSSRHSPPGSIITPPQESPTRCIQQPQQLYQSVMVPQSTAFPPELQVQGQVLLQQAPPTPVLSPPGNGAIPLVNPQQPAVANALVRAPAGPSMLRPVPAPAPLGHTIQQQQQQNLQVALQQVPLQPPQSQLQQPQFVPMPSHMAAPMMPQGAVFVPVYPVQ